MTLARLLMMKAAGGSETMTAGEYEFFDGIYNITLSGYGIETENNPAIGSISDAVTSFGTIIALYTIELKYGDTPLGSFSVVTFVDPPGLPAPTTITINGTPYELTTEGSPEESSSFQFEFLSFEPGVTYNWSLS
jgi:hypothetical protein